MYKIEIYVKLKKNVLDPQGKAIQQAAESLGFKDIISINQGKYFELVTKDISDPKNYVKKISEEILANEVIEDYKIIKIKKI